MFDSLIQDDHALAAAIWKDSYCQKVEFLLWKIHHNALNVHDHRQKRHLYMPIFQQWCPLRKDDSEYRAHIFLLVLLPIEFLDQTLEHFEWKWLSPLSLDLTSPPSLTGTLRRERRLNYGFTFQRLSFGLFGQKETKDSSLIKNDRQNLLLLCYPCYFILVEIHLIFLQLVALPIYLIGKVFCNLMEPLLFVISCINVISNIYRAGERVSLNQLQSDKSANIFYVTIKCLQAHHKSY